MIFLLFDYETTALGPKAGICEVGVILWDGVVRRVVRTWSTIVYWPDAMWDPRAIAKHHITPELAATVGMPQDKAFRQFMAYANSADVYVAYNGKVFDFPVWESWATMNGSTVPERLRLDPMVDIQWPPDYSRKLSYVCCEEGFINPFPHMGITDCLSMLVLLMKRPNLGEILEYAKMPEIWVEGVCSIDDRERVKSNAYHWLPYPVGGLQKKWIKKIKEGRLDMEVATGREVGYEVRVLG